MSRVPLEHDYIGLSDHNIPSSMDNNNGLKTELSLGLPGSISPERKHGCGGVTIFGKDFEGKTATQIGKGFGSGAKRGFYDAIDGNEKWVFGGNGKGDGNLSKDCNFNGVDNKKLGAKTGQKEGQVNGSSENGGAPATKAQVVGWPPIRSFRKNTLVSAKNNEQTEEKSQAACLYVKVSMDGAPYLRKVDLQTYGNYEELASALEKMFNCFITGQNGSNGHGKQKGLGDCQSTDLQNAENVLTYEDKDGDWMLVGDVPWRMFTENCRKLRIMKGSEAIGLAPNAAEKCKNEV